jgi:hypothetical protein
MTGFVGLLVHVLILAVAFAVLYWVIGLICSIMPPPIASIARVILLVLLALIALSLLLGEVGMWGDWGLGYRGVHHPHSAW